MKINHQTLEFNLVFVRFKFHFPFPKTNNMVYVDENRVGPLYKHVFPPQLAPRLCFVGLTFSMLFITLFALSIFENIGYNMYYLVLFATLTL